MRRLVLVTGALVVLVAPACGRDGGAATTAATSSTVEASTTTTEDPVAYRVTLATILAGEWTGQWTNLDSGSTGTVFAVLNVDEAGPSATLTLDLGGDVFGAGDPAAFEMMIDLAAAPPYSAATPLLGVVSLYMDDTGAFTLEAPDVPAAGIGSFRATGTATSERVDVDYTVGDEDGSEAAGFAVLLRPAS